MRFNAIYGALAMLLRGVFLASAQGTFQDLNFEEANVIPIVGQPFAVTVANALPGWSVDYGAVQQTQIQYNDPSLGGTAVTLIANGYPTFFGGSAIDGDFSVLLQGGLFLGNPAAATISQIGEIPSGIQSLLFDASGGPQQPPEVFVGSDLLSLFPAGSGVGNGVGYTVWGANVSVWAGQTEQLTFSVPSGVALLDDISFSPSTVPEPNGLVLTGIGGLLFALYRRFALKR